MTGPPVGSHRLRPLHGYLNTVPELRTSKPKETMRAHGFTFWLRPAILVIIGASPAGAQMAEVAVERRLAEELGLSVGDTVRLGPAPDSLVKLGTVAAIYEPRPDPAEIAKRERHIRLHLPELAALLGEPDRVDRFGIGLRPGVDPDSAAAALNRSAFGYRVHRSSAIASESSQTFLVVSRFHRAIAVISIVASAVFLLCIMMLKVEERRLDAAVMRFIGVRRRTIFAARSEERRVGKSGDVGGRVVVKI